MSRNTGVTLIEMLVAVSILAILMAVGIPGMQDYFTRNRLDSAASEFMGSLAYARSEALRRGSRVRMVRTSTTSGNWAGGWTMFADTNGDGTQQSGEETLRTGQALLSPLTFTANSNFSTSITYRSDGAITNSVGGTFSLCEGAEGWAIVVNGVGRARREKDNGTTVNPCS